VGWDEHSFVCRDSVEEVQELDSSSRIEADMTIEERGHKCI
jgi:hypothetical protein